MGALRDRMEKDLRVRRYSPRTIEAYLRHMYRFSRHFMQPPDKLGLEQIKEYQLYLRDKRGISWSNLNQFVCAARFFYGTVMDTGWNIGHIPYQRKPKELPVVLSREEIRRILSLIRKQKHVDIFMVIYGCGLRVNEALRMKAGDIDLGREIIHIRNGKGSKDRYAVLPERLREVLKEYIKKSCDRGSEWLFPARDERKHLQASGVQRAFRRAVLESGIRKKATVHTLRHSFATHLMESGVSLTVIQKLLGHRYLRTTSIYTHVSSTQIHKVCSPLDGLYEQEGSE